MLRQCAQAARRQRQPYRQWSSLPSSSSCVQLDQSDDADERQQQQVQQLMHRARHPSTSSISAGVGGANQSHNNCFIIKRNFSISRQTDKLTRHGTVNKVDDDNEVDPDAGPAITADDLEYDELVENDRTKEEMAARVVWDEEEGVGDDDMGGSDFDDIFGDLTGLNDDDKNDTSQEDMDPVEAAYHARQAQIAADLDKRTGRLWTDDWIISDEEWMSDDTFEDIEEWSPALATRKSLESVRVFEGGVPTLGEMAALSLPASLPPHPGHGAPVVHARFRKRELRRKLQTSIQLAIAEDLQKILKMTSWEEKQEAVDDLFETIEEKVREREPIMGKLPEFGNLVEEGLEKVLGMLHQRMQKDAKAAAATTSSEDAETEGGEEGSTGEQSKKKASDSGEMIDVMGVNDEMAVPVFMDILAATRLQAKQHSQSTSSDDGDDSNSDESEEATTTTASSSSTTRTLSKFYSESNKDDVPNLLYPLNVHPNEGIGRMVEEWQLAANKETKRVMMRDATRQIASAIVGAANCCGGEVKEEDKGAARVFVAGERGVGKTTALAGIVASARLSGHIVIYHPEGERLRKRGYYIAPCEHRKGYWNLPEIAKEFCQELITSHGEDIDALPDSVATKDYMKEFLTEDQIGRLFRRAHKEDESITKEEIANMTEMSLIKILTVGTGSAILSSGCYSMVIAKLMNQTSKPLTVVMDEYNCYYDHGHYFHMDYDFNVHKGVPMNRITIFKPFMDAMGLYPEEAGTDMSNEEFAVRDSEKAMMKWGSIVVGTSEGRSVRRSFTRSLYDSAKAISGDDQKHPVHVVDVRRFSNVEVQHNLYNFEITGIGRLRFDRGDTTLNPEEVEYLRLVSGGCGQQLMDACMVP